MEEVSILTKVDLHVHTTHSDGLLTPAQVVELAKEKGLQAIAITDHDVLTGIPEAREVGKAKGIEVIPGVEISTRWENQEIHILGYFIDLDHSQLRKALKKQREVRSLRNEMMVQKLNELGISITLDEVLDRKREKGSDKNVGRPHIAEVLIDKGIVQSMEEAFERYLGVEGLAYVTPERISAIEAVELVRNSGGVPVIAHPGLYSQDDLIPKLVEAGLGGIEVNHPDHSKADRQKYLEFAEKYNLITTAGSDFHGKRNNVYHHADLATCTVAYDQVVKLKQEVLKKE